MASTTWNAGKDGPKTVDELRKTLETLAKKKKGKALIDAKFTKDHIFAGHAGDPKKIAALLAGYRGRALSTLMVSSMDADAQAEVLNWIKKVPAARLTYANGTWTVATNGTTVDATKAYKFATVDTDALKGMNKDDIEKKSRNWLKESQKTPKVACQFDTDGTPLIYHLDY